MPLLRSRLAVGAEDSFVLLLALLAFECGWGYKVRGVAAIDAFINGERIENPSVELVLVLITPEYVDTPEVKALLQTLDKFEK